MLLGVDTSLKVKYLKMILFHRKQIPLDKNEGIYVQNLQSGKVRIVPYISFTVLHLDLISVMQLDP